MANRTRIVCLHEGEKGRSVDPVFINALLKELDPAWIRLWRGSNVIRLVNCGGRGSLIDKMPNELQTCLSVGSDTTLMVWADLDHDMADGECLKRKFWLKAQAKGITEEDFEKVVFVFAKDRIENWIEFLLTGYTDESKEGVRQKQNTTVVRAAKSLASKCLSGSPIPNIPPSLAWSCVNWKRLVTRMT